jgi:hypothetical protein
MLWAGSRVVATIPHPLVQNAVLITVMLIAGFVLLSACQKIRDIVVFS